MKITDRACWVFAANLSVKYLVATIGESDDTLSKRINRELKKHIKTFFKISTCPYTSVQEVKQKLNERSDDLANAFTTVYADVDIEFCIESPENEPEKLCKSFLHLMFDSMSQSVKSSIKMCAITNEIKLEESYKGYIQLDNTVFVPIPE